MLGIDLDEYADKASSYHVIKDIKVPTLYLMSKDDPIIRFDFPKEGFQINPNVALATTEGGGHIGS